MAARGADTNIVADAFPDHRRAHRGPIGDFAVAGTRLGRDDDRPGLLGPVGIADGHAATDPHGAIALGDIDHFRRPQHVLDLADFSIEPDEFVFGLAALAAIGRIAVGFRALQALLDLAFPGDQGRQGCLQFLFSTRGEEGLLQFGHDGKSLLMPTVRRTAPAAPGATTGECITTEWTKAESLWPSASPLRLPRSKYTGGRRAVSIAYVLQRLQVRRLE